MCFVGTMLTILFTTGAIFMINTGELAGGLLTLWLSGLFAYFVYLGYSE